MNKAQKELLEKAIDVGWNGKLPLFEGIYIIPQRKLHDSGFKQMYVIGHTEYNKETKEFKYYLIGTYSDVIDFVGWKGILKTQGLSLDINRNGIIHIWTRDKKIKCDCPFVSNCMLEIV